MLLGGCCRLADFLGRLVESVEEGKHTELAIAYELG